AFLLRLEEGAEARQLLRRRRGRSFLRGGQRRLARERLERFMLDGAAHQQGGDDERHGYGGDDGDADRGELARSQRSHGAARESFRAAPPCSPSPSSSGS